MCGGGSSPQPTVNNPSNVQQFGGWSALPDNQPGLLGNSDRTLAIAGRNNQIAQHSNGAGPVLGQLHAQYANPNSPVIPAIGQAMAVTGAANPVATPNAAVGSGAPGAGGGSIAGALGGMFGSSIYPSIQPAGSSSAAKVIR